MVKNNYFNFRIIVKQPVSDIAIGNKFMTTFGCIFMDRREIEFLKSWLFNLLVCYWYMVFSYLDTWRGKTSWTMINRRALMLILMLSGL